MGTFIYTHQICVDIGSSLKDLLDTGTIDDIHDKDRVKKSIKTLQMLQN